MKLNRPLSYVPFGPVGHPKARAFVEFERTSTSKLEKEFHLYLDRSSLHGTFPTRLFNRKLSLADNGYHLVPVVQDEIPDELLAKLPLARAYRPASADEPGRKIEHLLSWLPKTYHHSVAVSWNAGVADCNHDFGLESAQLIFREQASGNAVTAEAALALDYEQPGQFFVRMQCSRCGAVHVLENHGTV